MDVTPLVRSDLKVIQSYKNGSFRISGQAYSSAVIIASNTVSEWVVPEKLSDITPGHFEMLSQINNEIDVLLLGTGPQMQFFPPALREALKEKGLSVDAMDTGAACRTYNVLAAEGRRVAAALLPV